MDISNLTKNLSKGLQQKSNAELTALSRVLDIALGKVTIAQVTETIPVTPEERQALLNKTAAALQQLNKAAGTQPTPAAKEEIARLLEQQTLIKSPDLKWVNLLVNNRQLLTYSDKSLAAGQTVTVRLVAPEKLVLLDLPEPDTAETAAKTGSSDTLRSTYTAQSLATPAHTAKSIPAATEQKTQVSTPAEASAPTENSPETAIAIKSAATLASAAAPAKIQMAEVTETAPITADERQELLKKTTEELLQLGKLAQSTAGAASRELKEAIASLLQQQALIKSPKTQWVHLRVNGEALLTYSDKPLVVGQAVPVQVLTPQKILLLDLPEKVSTPTKTSTANTPDTKGSELQGRETETADSKLKLLTATINSALSATKNPTPTYFARLAAAEQSAASATQEETAETTIAAKNIQGSTGSAAPAKTYTATITQTAPLLPEERQELLKKTTEELAQLSKMASASAQPIPGLKEAINSLLQQQALIKAPAAKWVHLQVGNQSLLTYSDKSLSKGQSVPVQLVTAQKILLLDLPEADITEANSVNEKSVALPQKNPTPTYFAKFAAVESDSPVSEAAAEEPANKVEAKNTAALATTAVPAKIQMATIIETAPLLPEERKELLKKTTEELAQLNKIATGSTGATTPGAKEAIASLLQQQVLLKSPATQWLHLSVNNQTLLTYSDKPLTVGQAVPVQIINPQKIALLDLPDSNIKVLTETISSALATQKNITPTYFAQLAIATPATTVPSIQIANVTQTAPISTDERQELLKKTSEELLQLNKMPSTTPGIKEAITSLLQQQALIKSPDTKWLHLQVNNQSLVTYSDKPLTAGQSVPVQIITPQKILLLDLPEIKSAAAAASENLPAMLTAQKNATPTYFATLASAAEPAKASPPTNPIVQPQPTQTAPAANTQGKIEIATVVKTSQVSPQQRQELLQKISDDLQQINKLTSSSAQTIPSVKEVIASLLEQQALVKSPNLKWLELSVNNRPLTTYSDKPLNPGQTLQLQTTATQNLALLDSDQVAVSRETASAAKNTQQPEKLLPPADFPKSEFNDAEDTLPATASPISPWQNIPSLSREILTPKTVEQALKSVAEQIRAQLQVNHPANAATASKAAETNNQQQAPAANTANAQVTKTNVSAADISQTTTADVKLAGKNTQTIAGQSAMLVEIEQVLSGSNKQLSIQLTAKLLNELIKIQTATLAGNQATASNNTPAQTTDSLSQDIELAIQQLQNKSATDTATKEVRAQLLQLMKYDPETFKEMDISKLTQHLSKGLEQKNNAELSAISRALNITLGKVVMANVSETAPVTPQERKDLLAKTNEALAQLNKLASNPAQLTPATKAAISQLLEQQALIQSPSLKWATLTVNNQPLLTYTDKPLSAGQAVPVQLVDAQKLVLLTLPESGSTTKNSPVNLATAALGTNANPTYSAKLTSAALTADLAKNLTATNTLAPDAAAIAKAQTAAANSLGKPGAEAAYKPDAQQIKQVVAENLRRLLPYKDTPSELLSALTQWQKLPAASQQRLAPVTVEQALKNLAEQIRSPLQIIQPKILAQIIKNSGVFFENLLSNNLTSEAPDSGSAKSTTAESNKTLNPATNPSVAQTFNQDLKGSLLSLLSKVNQELTGSSKPLSDEQTVKLLQQLSSAASTSSAVGTTYTPANAAAFAKHNLPVDLGLLIQQVMTKPVKELSDKELRSQLLVLLQQHSVHSLAKIQLQQLASLNSEVANKDPSQPTASWQVEIPVRHHNEVQQLQLRIDREWVEEKNASAENKTVAKVKQWSVTLRFDLPTLGEFCAQLAIIDTSVSATLWASEERTFGQVRKQMDDLRKNLEKEGINVKQLQCVKGMPAEKPMALSYSLIDIST